VEGSGGLLQTVVTGDCSRPPAITSGAEKEKNTVTKTINAMRKGNVG
jgi:hypothetical protein